MQEPRRCNPQFDFHEHWNMGVPQHLRGDYPPGFFRWIATSDGHKIWKAFEEKALFAARRRSHYSAKAIVEVIRWETVLRDGSEFKISNNWTSGMARLWMHTYGDLYPKFFDIRDRLGRSV